MLAGSWDSRPVNASKLIHGPLSAPQVSVPLNVTLAERSERKQPLVCARRAWFVSDGKTVRD